MRRQTNSYPLTQADIAVMRDKMLACAQQFQCFAFFDSNHYPSAYKSYELLLATDAITTIPYTIADPLTSLYQLHETEKDWLFGHIGYDFKNRLEPKLYSLHPFRTGFKDFHFFIPATVCYIRHGESVLHIESIEYPDQVYQQIMSSQYAGEVLPTLSFNSRMTREQYIETITELRNHIAKGDCYEINFCNEGYCNDVTIDPIAAFRKLNELSPAPFAACYRQDSSYMMCASPERYLRKENSTLISQPIKGTTSRGNTAFEDEALKTELYNSIKERAENVMIVDLVRNDLARSCVTGSINVDELFGIYTFPQVHQMISTVSGTLKPDIPFADAIRHSFPMGSMTGAPKHKVMQLIEQYERSARELFSGTVGYIAPNGDFDFNVVIRSLFYNAASQYLCYKTGGAITYDSIPEQEWEEMRLKAWAMERILGG